MLLLVFCWGGSQMLFAQETETKTPRFTKSIKLHYRLPAYGFSLTKGGIDHSFSNRGSLIPAIEFATASGNFHEFGLGGIQYGSGARQDFFLPETNNGSVRLKTMSAGLHYDYAHQLFKQQPTGRFKLYAGFSASPHFSRNRQLVARGESLLSTRNQFGVNLDFVPRIRYDISKRFSLEASMPINLLALNAVRYKELSSSNDVSRRGSNFNFSAGSMAPQVKLGLVFRF